MKKYYSIAGMTIAMNDPSAGSGQAGLQFLLTDHASTSSAQVSARVVAITDSTGTLQASRDTCLSTGVQ